MSGVVQAGGTSTVTIPAAHATVAARQGRQAPRNPASSATDAIAKAACPTPATSPQGSPGARAANAASWSRTPATTPVIRLRPTAAPSCSTPRSPAANPSGTKAAASGTATRLARGATNGTEPNVDATSEPVAHCAATLTARAVRNRSGPRRVQAAHHLRSWRSRCGTHPVLPASAAAPTGGRARADRPTRRSDRAIEGSRSRAVRLPNQTASGAVATPIQSTERYESWKPRSPNHPGRASSEAAAANERCVPQPAPPTAKARPNRATLTIAVALTTAGDGPTIAT